MLRTRTPTAVLAAALAACDTAPAPTAPRAAAAAAPARAAPTLDRVPFSQEYRATEIPIIPNAINDSGVIAGYVGAYHAALYFNGKTTILARPGAVGAGYEATAINRRGVTVGRMTGGHGLYWATPTSAPRLILGPDGAPAWPLAINDSNVVVAQSRGRAFRWTDERGAEDITPPDYPTLSPVDINDAGYVVGWGFPEGSGPKRILRWAPGAGRAAEVLPGVYGSAAAIRHNGDVLIHAYEAPHVRIWTLSGQVRAVQGPTAQANEPTDLSAAGRVVGTATSKPWTFFQGTVTALPRLDPSSTGRAIAVNGCGSIVGREYTTAGEAVGVLWTKATCDVAGVYAP